MAKQLHDKALTIYTDGSCFPSPRAGGLGYLFVWTDENGEEQTHPACPPGWQQATNNQMELQAVVEALEYATSGRAPFDLSSFDKITIYSDAQYLTDNFNTAIYEWSRNGWTKRDGAPVRNTRVWKDILRLLRRLDRDHRLRVRVEWVKGHKKDPHNKAADKLARASAKGPQRRGFIQPARIRRKRSPNKVKEGSIRMGGQTVEVHIIVDQWLPAPHSCLELIYEVTDEASPYFECVDKITSKIEVRAGHVYLVRLNEDQGHPQIVEVLHEVDDADEQPEGSD
jgi:ribonuclease HI